MQWHAPGLVAVAVKRGQRGPAVDLSEALFTAGIANAEIIELDGVRIATWGLPGAGLQHGAAVLLSGTNWGDWGEVASNTVSMWVSGGDRRQVNSMLPPFAAVGRANGGFRLVTDSMGFRQIYAVDRPGWNAVATSARLLAILTDSGLDEMGVALQSQLGWQLEQRTLFSGVTKLSPGSSAIISCDGVVEQPADSALVATISLNEGVREATVLIRQFLSRYLEENPSTTLQLTGGQDSRLVLSGVAPARRRGLKVLTLAVPGSEDAQVAAQLSERYGMRHTVRSLDGLTRVTPEDAFERVCLAASRLDCMADPLAKAATLWAEESFDQGPRLSGLGGEIARGFYYTGRVRAVPVTRKRAHRLATWRMLANESVESVALSSELRATARPQSIELIYRVLAETGKDWYPATDELYARHRMQRWAGLGETAVCFDRQIVNPLLDRRFLDIADALSPEVKSNARFLARLQVSLDEDLAKIPLDLRPTPRQMARPGIQAAMPRQAARLRLARRKVGQRLQGARRPPPGGAVLADKVAQFIRENPGVIDPVRDGMVFHEGWLDGVAGGSVHPAPSSLAFLVNVLVATSRQK